MKDTILKIIFNHIGNVVESTPHYQSASEIAEMMTAFIEWSNDHFYGGIRWHVDGQDEMTTDELFTYWKETVYKKQ